jgi:glycosyltransferase involved in cell wall biosynthesis
MERETLNVYATFRGNGSTADAYYRNRYPWSVNLHFAGDRVDLTIGPLDDVNVMGKDVVLAQRPNTATEELILKIVKEQGIPLAVDVDDNLFDIPPTCGDIFDHYHFRGQHKVDEAGALHARKPLLHHLRCLRMADVITVPTARLAEDIAPYIGGTPIFEVLPNYVLRGAWDYIPKLRNRDYGDKPIVAWFGHFYHSHDLQWIAPTLADVLPATDAQLLLMGQPEALTLFPAELVQRTLVENLVPFDQFATVRHYIKSADVGICPLMPIRFNRGKSTLKALQFGAAGVPPVCSAVVYDQLPELDDLGLVAGDADQFGEILGRLLADKDERERLGREWQEIVVTRYCYESLDYEFDGYPAPQAMRWYTFARGVANGDYA